MHILISILVIIGLVVLGAAINNFIFLRSKEKSNYNSSTIPEKPPKLSVHDKILLEFYLKEWQVIIETQMHFNDLILRFRSITLTAFVTLIGAVVAIGKLGILQPDSIHLLFLLVFILWATSFIIDYLYYHRLLLGSVKEASKYDNSKYSKSLGLFGITKSISHQVRPLTSKWLVFIYYSLPTIGMVIIYFLLK